MADFYLDWGGDLQISDTGDFLIASGVTEITQRVVRRFLTNSATLDTTTGLAVRTPDYFFNGAYGGNARAYVDAVVNSELIASVRTNLLAQLAEESGINPSLSHVTVTQIANGLQVEGQIALNTGARIALPAVEITH